MEKSEAQGRASKENIKLHKYKLFKMTTISDSLD